jgi:hypothetical protein
MQAKRTTVDQAITLGDDRRLHAIRHIPTSWITVNEKPDWPVERNGTTEQQPKRPPPEDKNGSDNYGCPDHGHG